MIINANCIDYLKTVPDNTYDIILTSPPFKDEDIEGDFWEFYDSFFKECMRVCNKVCIIIFSATKMNDVIQKYPPKRTLIWGKGVVKYSWRYNPIFVYEKNGYKVNPHIWSDTFGIQPLFGSQKVHKYQDPIELYSLLLSMFKDCETVLDPFGGSGTTAIAAMKNNKEYTLIEIDSHNIDVIKKRIEDSSLQSTICGYYRKS